MKRLQIYGNGRVYAIVNGCGNYSINTESEALHGFTGFRQDGSWMPVAPASAPAWIAERIEDFDLFDADEA